MITKKMYLRFDKGQMSGKSIPTDRPNQAKINK